MKKISSFIKEVGMLSILKDCNFNLRSVRNYLIRECNLPEKGFDMHRKIKKFEDLLRESRKEPIKFLLLREIAQKIKEEV